MATTTPQRSNSATGDDVSSPLDEELAGSSMDDDPTKSTKQDTGPERSENNNNNGSKVVHDETRSPDEALDEIKKQQTHKLYCPVCKSNITTDAEIFLKGQEPDPYKADHFVLSVPLVIPFKFPTSPLLRFSLAGPWKKLKELFLNCLPRLSPTSLRFLSVAVLLLLSLIVLWSSHFPLSLPGLSSLSPSPGTPSPLPSPGTHSPLPLPGSPSLSPTPGLHSPSPVPGPNFPLPLSGPDPQPRPHIYENIRWLIHFPSIKYLPLFSLLLLAIMVLLWPKVHVPPNRNGKTQVSTKRSEEGITPSSSDRDNKTTEKAPGAEENKERVTEQNDVPDNGIPNWMSKFLLSKPPQMSEKKTDLVTQENPVDGLGTNTEIPSERKPVRLVLWNNVVVPVLNLFPLELDILKSIVYGGLIESMTSLGVVSSAAGSGASTVNVIALGVANLFSGLFLIIHSLYGLITFQRPSHSSSKEQNITYLEDRALYKDRLGNYKKVKLHCFVVVVSFIFFAVIPPLFYGLSFKITDNGHYQAAVVLAASLVCVISLSFAKAHAFDMKKLRTVAEYTGMAIGASALSFVTSQLVSDLLEKYGFHDTV